MSAAVISQVEEAVEKTIDREKVCPLLLRIFCSNIRHNPTIDYGRGNVPPNELQIYTWMDCSLKELMSLIKDVNADARARGTEFAFAIVYPERNFPRYSMREIGITVNGQRGVDDSKTLEQCKFEVGDYIDVAIRMPRPDRGGVGGDRRGGGDRGFFGDRDRGGGGGGGRFGGRDRDFRGGDRSFRENDRGGDRDRFRERNFRD